MRYFYKVCLDDQSCSHHEAIWTLESKNPNPWGINWKKKLIIKFAWAPFWTPWKLGNGKSCLLLGQQWNKEKYSHKRHFCPIQFFMLCWFNKKRIPRQLLLPDPELKRVHLFLSQQSDREQQKNSSEDVRFAEKSGKLPFLHRWENRYLTFNTFRKPKSHWSFHSYRLPLHQNYDRWEVISTRCHK